MSFLTGDEGRLQTASVASFGYNGSNPAVGAIMAAMFSQDLSLNVTQATSIQAQAGFGISQGAAGLSL